MPKPEDARIPDLFQICEANQELGGVCQIIDPT